MRMKRKEVEGVSDDFSHFSASAPASKIRRLDAEMLGINVTDDDVEMLGTDVMDDAEVEVEVDSPATSPSPSSSSQEMFIVVYKPTQCNFSMSLHPHNFSAVSHLMRNQFLPSWSNHPDFKSAHEQAEAEAETLDGENCMAVVPWVGGFETQEMMEVEQEVQEQQPNIITQSTTHPLSQFHQFHCMPPQLPTTTVATAPVTWFH